MFQEPHAKKVEYKVTSKKIKNKKIKKLRTFQAQTLEMKKWENGSHLTVMVKKNNVTYTVLMLNYVSDIAYEA